MKRKTSKNRYEINQTEKAKIVVSQLQTLKKKLLFMFPLFFLFEIFKA